MNDYLLIEMVERMSVAATLAFILSQTASFRRISCRRITKLDRVILTGFFGLVGIFGTYAGIPVNDALANSRVIGVMAAGLVGGPAMGLGAGMIAGGHRYFQGGFTALSCALANICEGLLAGFIHRIYPTKPIPWWVALLAGVFGEFMQMGIILATARPFGMSLSLVKEIAVPMIVVNSVGLAIFMLIMKTAKDAQEKVGAEQSRKALDIASKTLPFLRRGLNKHSANETVRIIMSSTGYDAVAITDTEQILAITGAEAGHHALATTLTQATRSVIDSGTIHIAQTRKDIECACLECRLASAVIVPLTRDGVTIGTLKLFYTRVDAIGESDIVFATGLAHLFSTQLELTEIDRQAKLAARARLKALQSQINPHFFFNTLNTITSLIRTKPDLARELLIKLGAIFRFTLRKTGRDITIAEEIAQVEAYLAIEQVRYGEKLKVEVQVDQTLTDYYIPSLSIQPLVENAIRHGLQPKEEGGVITLKVNELADNTIEIAIADNGVGIDLNRYHPLEKPESEQGVGLINVHERLGGQFGPGFGLAISSAPGFGTTVTIRLPKRLHEEVEDCA